MLDGLNKVFPHIFILDVSHNQICVHNDFDMIEFMDSLTDIDARGNICSQIDEKEYESPPASNAPSSK